MLNLVQLDLRNNQIATIHDRSFLNVKKLEILDLSCNNLTLDFNRDLFSCLYHLSYLNLSNNQIERIDDRLFSKLFNLIILDLSYNQLKVISNYSFKNVNLLTFLDISFNFDLNLDETSLNGLDSIKDIWISFELLQTNENNRIYLKNSLKLNSVRSLADLVYYQSIYINYREEIVDCMLTLEFIKLKIQLRLKSDSDFLHFFENCYSIDFSKILTFNM